MYKYLFSLLFLLSFSAMIYSQDMDAASMDDQYKAIYNKVLNALLSGDTNDLGKYISPDFVENDPSPVMSTKTGVERVKEDFAYFHKIYPDMKAKVHSIAVSGDMLFAYLTFTGTSAEPGMGMPAGHKLDLDAIDLIRFKGNMAVEHWGFTSNEDIMKMMQQEKSIQGGTDKK